MASPSTQETPLTTEEATARRRAAEKAAAERRVAEERLKGFRYDLDNAFKQSPTNIVEIKYLIEKRIPDLSTEDTNEVFLKPLIEFLLSKAEYRPITLRRMPHLVTRLIQLGNLQGVQYLGELNIKFSDHLHDWTPAVLCGTAPPAEIVRLLCASLKIPAPYILMHFPKKEMDALMKDNAAFADFLCALCKFGARQDHILRLAPHIMLEMCKRNNAAALKVLLQLKMDPNKLRLSELPPLFDGQHNEVLGVLYEHAFTLDEFIAKVAFRLLHQALLTAHRGGCSTDALIHASRLLVAMCSDKQLRETLEKAGIFSLYEACKSGNVEVLAYLFKRLRFDIYDLRTNSAQLLAVAFESECEEVIEFLFNEGVELRDLGDGLELVFRAACARGDVLGIRKLYDKGLRSLSQFVKQPRQGDFEDTAVKLVLGQLFQVS